MPTPMPDLGQIQQLNKNLSDIVQQGIVGFLLLAGIIGVLLAATLLVLVWSRRNRKPDNNTANTGEAMLAFAQMNKDQLAEAKENKEYQRKKDEQTEKRFEEQNERQIESNTAMSDAVNRLGDVLNSINVGNQLQSQTVLAMQTDVRQMTEVGSKPLQGLVDTAQSIKGDTELILEHMNKIEELLQKQADCVDIIDRLKKLEELVREQSKRETSTNATVLVPEQTLNITLDNPPAGDLPKAS